MKHNTLPNSQLKITVITVVLNDKVGLEETINSALIQTYKNLEYIVIDGNSSDGTVEVIKKYSSKINKWISEPDSGIFNAMNKGIDLASGDYALFLNAGDRFANKTVTENIFTNLEQPNKNYTNRQLPILVGDVALYEGEVFKEIIYLYPWLPHQGAWVRVDLLKQYRFDDNFKIYGDLDLWTRMKKNDDFHHRYFPIVISHFKLGGVGNHPRHLTLQLRDKAKYNIKHHNYFRLVLESLSFIIEIFLHKFFPKSSKRFKEKIHAFKQQLKKMII